MQICILIIATNKYLRFAERLLADIRQYFLIAHQIHVLLFTDHAVDMPDHVRVCPIRHEPWPMTTLKRYHYFLQEQDFISQFDYCFYMDADMAIVDIVGEEVLGDRVATLHPYQSFCPKEQRSYDRNPQSLAYVPIGEEGEHYVAGGFNGGSAQQFLEMADVLAARIDTDLANGVMALWHDESHMNRYLIDHPPTVILSPAYCFAEEHVNHPRYPDRPKIIALQKNHSECRS